MSIQNLNNNDQTPNNLSDSSQNEKSGKIEDIIHAIVDTKESTKQKILLDLFHKKTKKEFFDIKKTRINTSNLVTYDPRIDRYNDIIPYANTVVSTLSGIRLNANYITFKCGEIYENNYKLIASQAPKILGDFWLVMVEQQVPIIIMLSNFIENNVRKAEEFFPQKKGDVITYGDVEVLCKKIIIKSRTTKYSLICTNKSKTHKLKLVMYNEWCDHGIPTDNKSVSRLINKIIKSLKCGGVPVILCSAGVGRTGTIISAVGYILYGGKKSLPSIVKEIRIQRMHMVQTFEQYSYIYKVLDYIRNINHNF